MSARVGVILSGCGVRDGAEIQEAVSILVALDKRGATAVCMAPNTSQAQVINHFTQQPDPHARNVLHEAARIARGNIVDLAKAQADDLDAIVFPGGYGAVKNLCTFADDGTRCSVNPNVDRLLTDMHRAGKPIGLACIAPVIAAAVLGKVGAQPALTVGSEGKVPEAIRQMGGVHHAVGPTDIHIDSRNRLVTTPCYMNEVGPWTVFQGADRMVEAVLAMVPAKAAR